MQPGQDSSETPKNLKLKTKNVFLSQDHRTSKKVSRNIKLNLKTTDMAQNLQIKKTKKSDS